MRSVDRAEIPAAARFLGDRPTDGGYVTLTIRDTGDRMDRQTLSRIFDPFFSTKFVGLRLAAVHGIVRGQGGAILVESQPGAGTTFSIYVPATDKTLATTPNGGPVQWIGDATVLFVDDEHVVTALATEILEGANLTVIDARDGQETVDIFRQRHDEIDRVVRDSLS